MLINQINKENLAYIEDNNTDNDADNFSDNEDVQDNSKEIKTNEVVKKDIKQMLLNQKRKKINYDVNDVIEIEDNHSKNEHANKDDEIINEKMKISNFFQKEFSTEATTSKGIQRNNSSLNMSGENATPSYVATQMFDDVDYVVCATCKKKILCWEMPEHEDFHFAQLISKEFTKSVSQLSESENVSITKRKTMEETPNKPSSSKEASGNTKNSKKLKINLDVKTNDKSIDNYFKKKS